MATHPRNFRMVVGICGLVCAASANLACQGEDIAPTCSVVGDQGQCLEPSPGLVLALDCSTLPRAVASANYEFVIQHPGLPPGHTSSWEAEGLPPGLVMEQGGILRGRPEQVGTYSEIKVTMTDMTTAQRRTVSCGPLQVHEALSLDLSQTKHGCVSYGDRMQDFLRGGTDEALHCEVPMLDGGGAGCPHGLGNGRMPAGLSVQKDCTLSGELAPNQVEDGTFTWMVELRQSGAQLFVPFCVTSVRKNQHEVEIFKGGVPQDRYAPLHVNFVADQPLRAGTKLDPRIRVTSACAGTSCATRGISVRGTCSPFDAAVNELLDGSAEPVSAVGGRTIGMMHGYNLHTGAENLPASGLGQRPWVLNISGRYCTSDLDPSDPCTHPSSLVSHTTWSVIAWPSTQMPKLPGHAMMGEP